MKSQTFFLLLVSVLLPTRISYAGSVEAKSRAARLACLSGDYTKGVAILAELFIDTHDVNFIYNSGRCFQQNLRYAEALGRFQEYLRVGTDLDAKAKSNADQRIAECQDLLAKQASQPTVAAPPPAPSVAASPAATTLAPSVAKPAALAPMVDPSPADIQQTNPQVASGPGAGQRTAGIVTAAIGGAGIVAGVVFNLKFNGLTSDIQDPDGYTHGRASDRDTYKTLSMVGYGAGVVCLFAGGVLYYLGLQSGRAPAPSVALVPALAPGQAGALLKGAF